METSPIWSFSKFQRIKYATLLKKEAAFWEGLRSELDAHPQIKYLRKNAEQSAPLKTTVLKVSDGHAFISFCRVMLDRSSYDG